MNHAKAALGILLKRNLTNVDGDQVASVAFTGGVKSVEFDGAAEGADGQTYYVYSRVGSAADEHFLIV
ncbi:hypothetical protein [Sphingomonas solaris]|uniref:Uncharacterized protein n=1 Tax=Alterirhizorhabdus solaris TaxID=2529389 RepID=A0A558QS30_9SPHN|nr:hypothetical protein [Sphingomonas solaris]TVV69950.1 hypothetical protein FOY91_20315 [Sphingomonas solaris]